MSYPLPPERLAEIRADLKLYLSHHRSFRPGNLDAETYLEVLDTADSAINDRKTMFDQLQAEQAKVRALTADLIAEQEKVRLLTLQLDETKFRPR